jgi:hypothetical protein
MKWIGNQNPDPIENELSEMLSKKQLAALLGIPEGRKIGIQKNKLARALVLKWKVENNE